MRIFYRWFFRSVHTPTLSSVDKRQPLHGHGTYGKSTYVHTVGSQYMVTVHTARVRTYDGVPVHGHGTYGKSTYIRWGPSIHRIIAGQYIL